MRVILFLAISDLFAGSEPKFFILKLLFPFGFLSYFQIQHFKVFRVLFQLRFGPIAVFLYLFEALGLIVSFYFLARLYSD